MKINVTKTLRKKGFDDKVVKATFDGRYVNIFIESAQIGGESVWLSIDVLRCLEQYHWFIANIVSKKNEGGDYANKQSRKA